MLRRLFPNFPWKRISIKWIGILAARKHLHTIWQQAIPSLSYQLQISGQNLRILLRKNTHCDGKYVKLVRPGILRTCVQKQDSLDHSRFLNNQMIFRPSRHQHFWEESTFFQHNGFEGRTHMASQGVGDGWKRWNHSYVTDYHAEEAEGCCCWGSWKGAPSLLLMNAT